MIRHALLLCLFGFAAAAQQTTPWYFESLRTYLTLTQAQIDRITANNKAYDDLVEERQGRIFGLQLEINVETEKENVDPLALGTRYADIESQCRFLDAEASRVLQRNREVLTEAQRAKLDAFEEVLKLLPTINEAQSARLMKAGTPAPANRLLVPIVYPGSGSGLMSFTTFLLGNPTTACGGVRSGLSRIPFPFQQPPIQHSLNTPTAIRNIQ